MYYSVYSKLNTKLYSKLYSKLYTTCLQSYQFINKYVPILLYEKNNHFLHNQQQVKRNGKMSHNTFEGKLSCGASCFLLQYFLKQRNIHTELYYSKRGHGKYIEDHCFLLYNDYIIDPTYRQFFSENSDKYSDYLFNQLPFVFIGKYSQLENIYNKLYKIDNNIDNNLNFWKDSKILNREFYLEDILNDFDFAKSKGTCFETLYNNIR